MISRRFHKRLLSIIGVAMMSLAGTGCTQYFRVTDVNTGKVYYTSKVDRQKNGAVRLEDARSGAQVTLQSSEVRRISKDTFNEETR